MGDQLGGGLVTFGAVAYVIVVCMIMRRILSGALGPIQGPARKLITYGMPIGGVAALLFFQQAVGPLALMAAFLTFMGVFFAVLTAE